MKKQEKAARSKRPSMSQEMEEGFKELLLWQSWQLHAKLRQRFMQSDPQAVAMIDALVRAFYASRWAGSGFSVESVMEEVLSGQQAIGTALPDEEALAIMRVQTAGYFS